MLGWGVLLAVLAAGPQLQNPRTYEAREKPDVILPSGKSQREEILKADFAKSKTDAAEMADLAHQLKADLDKIEPHVLDMRALRKAEQIEKLARRIKDRMKRQL